MDDPRPKAPAQSAEHQYSALELPPSLANSAYIGLYEADVFSTYSYVVDQSNL
jgi:hypothetical protein